MIRGRSRWAAARKLPMQRMNAPEGKDIVLARTFQSKSEGTKYQVQIEGLVESRVRGLGCQGHRHVIYPKGMAAWSRHVVATLSGGRTLEKAAFEGFRRIHRK